MASTSYWRQADRQAFPLFSEFFDSLRYGWVSELIPSVQSADPGATGVRLPTCLRLTPAPADSRRSVPESRIGPSRLWVSE